MFSSFSLRKSARQNRLRLLVLALGALFVTSAWPLIPQAKLQSSDQQNTRPKTYKPEFVPGEILVRFRPETLKARSQTAKTEMLVQGDGREISVQVEQLDGVDVVEGLRMARVAPEETLQAISALNARPDVLYAEPNYIRRASKTPNDTYYSQMWNLKNIGQDVGGHSGVSGVDIHAEPAWETTTGSKSIVVGVIDEGIDINHPDLKDNIWTNPAEIPNNGVDDDGNGYVDDINGWDFAHNDNTVFDYTNATYPPASNYNGDVDDHGTHVAGTIGAMGNNATGVTGVNWQVSLMSLKFLTGVSGDGNTADSLKAYSYAKMMKELWQSSGGTKGANIRVLNNSYGGGGFSQSELDAIRALGDDGILFVVAAGNDGLNNDMFPTYPANYISTNMISVAASTNSGIKASFSNFGPGTVNMAAPGENILSTTPKGTYNYFSGTSMAAPHVSGGAALVCAAYPNLSMSKLRSTILYSGYVAQWQGLYIYNISSGRTLDVNGALQTVASADNVAPAAVAQFHSNSSNFPTFSLSWQAPGDDGNAGKVAAYEVRYSDTDLSDPAKFDLAIPLPGPIPETAGMWQSDDVRIPWRHSSGFIGIRAVDEAGNAGPISTLPLNINADTGDPYTMTESAPSPLSTGGTPLGLTGDDQYKNVNLPFAFKFYEGSYSNIWISTNGAIYFSFTPSPNDGTLDAFSSVSKLNGYRMIAGAWDDLRMDRRAGDDVYVVQPDENRIIYRWQGVTVNYQTPSGVERGENPVNFEVELRSDGTIIMRYGDGNQKMFSVVGIGGGWPEAYVVDSHTVKSGVKDLTNAQTVTFALRKTPPPPTSNLSLTMTSTPNPVGSGAQVTYDIEAYNDGPQNATNTVVTDQLPAGTTFVSCTTTIGTCTGPASGTNGTVTANIGTLNSATIAKVRIIVQVTAAAGATISNTASVNSSRFDSNTANNSATTTTQVVADSVFNDVVAISAGGLRTFVLKRDGTIWGWGNNDYGMLGDGSIYGNKTSPVPVATNLTGVTAIAGGGNHTLALKNDGTVWAWGTSDYGEVGNTSPSNTTPVLVNGVSNVIAISSGNYHSMALRDDGTVWVWGANMSGQLGLGGAMDAKAHPTPTQVPGLTGVKQIAAGNDFSLAVRDDGTVWAWGSNTFGQLGDNTGGMRNSAAQISGLTGVKSVVGGQGHALALKTDGTVWGWGANTFGATGSSNYNQPTYTPVQVNNLSNITAIAAGGWHSLASKSDGSVWAWGWNTYGQLGTGTQNSSPQSNPSQVSGLAGATSVSAGSDYSVALLGDGTVRTWGRNYYGQLGDGTTLDRYAPVQVSGVLVVALPSISPGSETAYPTIYAQIVCATAGATIHYTTNGQDPTESSPVFTPGSFIPVNQSLTLKARAYKSGWNPSPVAFAVYTVLLAPNPIDDAQTFVRWQYRDFLNREADSDGLNYWMSQITSCGSNAQCIHDRRVGVSDAFFFEDEFQKTGGYIYRVFKAASGQKPTFAQFMADRGQVVAGAGLDQSKSAYALAFIQRDDFLQTYPRTQTADQFVDALLGSIKQNSGVDLSSQRTSLIALHDGTDQGRAAILKQVADAPAFTDAEYNSSFVLMEYFGYLRRDPEAGGFEFWLEKVNRFPLRDVSIQHAMACSFITSAEYQLRFGSSVTHSNQECPQ